MGLTWSCVGSLLTAGMSSFQHASCETRGYKNFSCTDFSRTTEIGSLLLKYGLGIWTLHLWEGLFSKAFRVVVVVVAVVVVVVVVVAANQSSFFVDIVFVMITDLGVRQN